jgi:hypothetical protein
MSDIRQHLDDLDPERKLSDQNPKKPEKSVSSQKSEADSLLNSEQKCSDKSSSAILPRNIEKIQKTWQGPARPNPDSDKTDNPGDTPPTHKLGSREWEQQQWADFLHRSGMKSLTNRYGIELPSDTDIKSVEGHVTKELEEIDSQRGANALGVDLPPQFTKELSKQDIEATQKPEAKHDLKTDAKDIPDEIVLQKARERAQFRIYEGKYRLFERNLSLLSNYNEK